VEAKVITFGLELIKKKTILIITIVTTTGLLLKRFVKNFYDLCSRFSSNSTQINKIRDFFLLLLRLWKLNCMACVVALARSTPWRAHGAPWRAYGTPWHICGAPWRAHGVPRHMRGTAPHMRSICRTRHGTNGVAWH